MIKSHFNDEFLVLLGPIISRFFACSNEEKKPKQQRVRALVWRLYLGKPEACTVILVTAVINSVCSNFVIVSHFHLLGQTHQLTTQLVHFPFITNYESVMFYSIGPNVYQHLGPML